MKKRYYVYLIYLIMLTFAVTAVSFSRYRTVVEGRDQAAAARPVVTYAPRSLMYNGSPVPDISGGINLSDVMPGDVLVYEFDINNYDEDKENQVLMKYMITVLFDPAVTTLPLTYTLIPGGDYLTDGEGWSYGDWSYLGFGEQITHSYTLTVTWDEAEVDPMYTNQQQCIQIQINSQQANS